MSDSLKREKARKATAKYKAANRNEINARYRERLATDPEFRARRQAQVAESVKKWKAAHPDEALSRGRLHYLKYREIYREQARAYYHAHKEERRAYSRQRHREQRGALLAKGKARALRIKAEVMAAYGGAVCTCCGELRMAFLTIDHIDGCGTARRRAEGSGGTFYGWLKKRKFPPGYRVLCFNCNCGRRVNGGQCPHEEERAAAAK